MARMGSQVTPVDPVDHDLHVGPNEQRPIVEQDVAVRTQAKGVLWDVGAAVRATEALMCDASE